MHFHIQNQKKKRAQRHMLLRAPILFAYSVSHYLALQKAT